MTPERKQHEVNVQYKINQSVSHILSLKQVTDALNLFSVTRLSTIFLLIVFTKEVIFLVLGLPGYPWNPVISHTIDDLAAQSLSEHGQILQQRARLTKPGRRDSDWGCERAYLGEVKIVLEGQRDISVDVNLLLSINVLWTHLSPWHSTLPREL